MMSEVAIVQLAGHDLYDPLAIETTDTLARVFDGPREYRLVVRTPSAAGHPTHFEAVIAEAFRLGRESR